MLGSKDISRLFCTNLQTPKRWIRNRWAIPHRLPSGRIRGYDVYHVVGLAIRKARRFRTSPVFSAEEAKRFGLMEVLTWACNAARARRGTCPAPAALPLMMLAALADDHSLLPQEYGVKAEQLTEMAGEARRQLRERLLDPAARLGLTRAWEASGLLAQATQCTATQSKPAA